MLTRVFSLSCVRLMKPNCDSNDELFAAVEHTDNHPTDSGTFPTDVRCCDGPRCNGTPRIDPFHGGTPHAGTMLARDKAPDLLPRCYDSLAGLLAFEYLQQDVIPPACSKDKRPPAALTLPLPAAAVPLPVAAVTLPVAAVLVLLVVPLVEPLTPAVSAASVLAA